MPVLLVATMDTKGREAGYLKSCLEAAGVEVWIMDAGIRGQSPVPVEITREKVAGTGGMLLKDVQNLGHEGRALEVMVRGAVTLARSRAEHIQGIIGLGGSMGTTLGTAVMRAFPFGLPKIMISTMASRDTRAFVGAKDICLFHSVADLAGLNRITKTVLHNGAGAMAGMVRAGRVAASGTGPVAGLSTLGTTEVCAENLRQTLGQKGWEVVTFHTVGAGGQALEEMISNHELEAVIDLSLHELVDHHFGGDYDAGPDRGRAAGRQGLPVILVPGNIDFLVTGPLAMAQKKFPGRAYHVHNAAITTIRTSKEEIAALARIVARRANAARGPAAVVVPLQGFSAFDHPENGPMPDPEAPHIFTETIREELHPDRLLYLEDRHINDPGMAPRLVEILEKISENK